MSTAPETTAPAEPAVEGPRQRILVAAHALFYRDGIRATGIDRVIAEARVTKVTFYRQFRSKTDLVHAYLDYRHGLWMDWLHAALARQRAAGAAGPDALLGAFAEWWGDPAYRGCAFINAAVEVGGSDAAVLDTVRRHKAEMSAAFEPLLPDGADRAGRAAALSLAVDGAIVQAQSGVPLAVLQPLLRRLVAPLFA